MIQVSRGVALLRSFKGSTFGMNWMIIVAGVAGVLLAAAQPGWAQDQLPVCWVKGFYKAEDNFWRGANVGAPFPEEMRTKVEGEPNTALGNPEKPAGRALRIDTLFRQAEPRLGG